MTWLKGLQPHSWWLANLSIAGLLVAIAVAGLVALGINDRVRDVLVQAIAYDLEIEDRADDLRVAVLDVRHYHRNLVFYGPSPRRVTDFETAYDQLLLRIDELQQLGIEAPNLVTPEQMREVAELYYADFRPAIDFFEEEPQTFDLVSDDGLWLLAELESDARRVERFGERQASVAVGGVEEAANSARALLILKLIGHILIGVALAYLIRRNLSEQQHAAGELTHALQLKNDFIADMSHELRTPLTVLRANAEVALALERTCVHTELLEEIVVESERMTRLVEDLLFLARSDSGVLPLEWELVSIGPFLNEFSERASVLVSQYGAEFHLDLEARGLIRIDPTRIAQALLNLVDNGVKYSPEGTTVSLSSKVNSTDVIIEVTDQGPGISEQDLAFIFERFYRVDKARVRKSGGAGLGLAIAKSIVIAHGGRIEVESMLNKGTTMRIHLPLLPLMQALHLPAEHLSRGEPG